MMSAKQETLLALKEAKELREEKRAKRAARICKLARDGHTPTEIQRALRCCYDTVAKALGDAGIAPTLRPGSAREEG